MIFKNYKFIYFLLVIILIIVFFKINNSLNFFKEKSLLNNFNNSSKISIVTSINVYSDIVKYIGRDKVNVKSIINLKNQDLHNYELTVYDRLILAKSNLAIFNGSNHDSKMLDIRCNEIHNCRDNSINIIDLTNLRKNNSFDILEKNKIKSNIFNIFFIDKHTHDSFNEHFWYDIEVIEKLSDLIALKLSILDQKNTQFYYEYKKKFKELIKPLKFKIDKLKIQHAGKPIAVIEELPMYLFNKIGLDNKTPSSLLLLTEEKSELSIKDFKIMNNILLNKQVDFLSLRSQSDGLFINLIKQTACKMKIPILFFDETMLKIEDYNGKSDTYSNYIEWMNENIEKISFVLNNKD